MVLAYHLLLWYPVFRYIRTHYKWSMSGVSLYVCRYFRLLDTNTFLLDICLSLLDVNKSLLSVGKSRWKGQRESWVKRTKRGSWDEKERDQRECWCMIAYLGDKLRCHVMCDRVYNKSVCSDCEHGWPVRIFFNFVFFKNQIQRPQASRIHKRLRLSNTCIIASMLRGWILRPHLFHDARFNILSTWWLTQQAWSIYFLIYKARQGHGKGKENTKITIAFDDDDCFITFNSSLVPLI